MAIYMIFNNDIAPPPPLLPLLLNKWKANQSKGGRLPIILCFNAVMNKMPFTSNRSIILVIWE